MGMFAGGRKKKFVNQPHQPDYTEKNKNKSKNTREENNLIRDDEKEEQEEETCN